MPRVWLWVREHVYAELERIVREEGKSVDDLIKELIEAYVKGELVLKNQVKESLDGRIERLERRVELLEEMLRYLLSTSQRSK